MAYTDASTVGKKVKFKMLLDKSIDEIGTSVLTSDDYQGMIVFTANGIVLNGKLVGEPNGDLESAFAQQIKVLTANPVFSGALVSGYLLLNSNDTDATEKTKYRFFSSSSNAVANLLSTNADEGKIYYDKGSGAVYFYVADNDKYYTISELYSSLADTYLTKTAASNTYLTKTAASSTYATTSALNSFKSTVESSYAKLASPTFTGTPKAPTAASGTDTTQIATTAFVQQEISSKIAAANAMTYKGVVNADSDLDYMGAKAGWTYKVGTAGTYAKEKCEVGDMIICLTDGNGSATPATWQVVQANIDGAVTGPSTAVNGNLALFDGTTGKIIKDGGTIKSENPALSFGNTLTLGNVGSTTFKVTMPANPNTDTKVTSVDNHYTPAENSSSALTASSTTAATWGSTSVVTGLKRDAKGHVVGLTSIKFPANPNTTYSAGTGLTLSGTTFNHSNSIDAGTAGTSSPTSGSSIAIPYVTYDAQGHVTASGTHTHTVSGFATTNTVTGYCDTAAATAAKSITYTGYKLRNNSAFFVTFVNGNTATGAITLNINGTGAKGLYVDGTLTSSSATKTFDAGVYPVAYASPDGTNYYYYLYTTNYVPISVESATKATQDANGKPIASTYIKGLSVSGKTITYTKGDDTTGTIITQDTDTKNTAGSTDTSSKIFIIGATSQAANPQTYSQDTAYVGTDGCLYSGGTKVLVTSDIASTVSSSSKDSQVASAKAVYNVQTTANNAYDSANSALDYLTWQ